jgi:hypothetical protein
VLHNLIWDLLDITLHLSIGVLASDKTFCGEEGVFWVDNSLSFCGDTDQSLTVFRKTDDGWCCSGACGRKVRDDGNVRRVAALSPSAFSIIRGTLPSMTATAEFVVPRSMPMTWPLTFSSA